MATERALGRLIRNQCIFVRVAFDVVFDFTIVFVESRFLHGRLLLQHLTNIGRVPKPRVLHQLVVLLVVEVVLPDAVAVKLMLSIPRGELKAITGVLVLACEDGSLPVLDLLVQIGPSLKIRVPLERV